MTRSNRRKFLGLVAGGVAAAVVYGATQARIFRGQVSTETAKTEALQTQRTTTITPIIIVETRLTPSWRRLEPKSAPPQRSNHTSIIDKLSRVIIFGGRNDQGSLSDTWAFYPSEGTWRRIETSGGPPARFGHTAIYDPAKDRMIIYSGQGDPGRFFNDLWALSFGSDRWERIAASPNPAPRYGSILVYDENNSQALTFAGFTDQGRFNDLWSLDLSKDSWLEFTPTAPSPMKRCLHTGVFATGQNMLMIYGGQSAGALGDVWAYDVAGRTWRDLTPSIGNPLPRYFVSSVYEPDSKLMLIFGGQGDGRSFNDLLAFDFTSNSLKQIDIRGERPTERHSTTLTRVNPRRAILFGGSSGSHTDETWELQI